MLQRLVLVALLTVVSLFGGSVGANSYAPAVSKAAPSVVNIYTKQTISVGQQPYQNNPYFRFYFKHNTPQKMQRSVTNLGSGVIVGAGGYILTNNHVVKRAQQIRVMLADGRQLKAQIVGTDPETDLAILKIKAKKLVAIQLGNSDNLRVGDIVLAIGNPFGLKQTVTQGIVSALGRDALGLNQFENFIQTDAAINPGNSGGALINAQGQLIGINSAMFSRSGGYQGIGFAIPVNLATRVMQEIISNGRVRRGWLGVSIKMLSVAQAGQLKLQAPGVLITGIAASSPAYSGGLRLGDLLVAVNGEKVKSARGFLKLIASIKPGQKIKVDILRANKRYHLFVKVGLRPYTGRSTTSATQVMGH